MDESWRSDPLSDAMTGNIIRIRTDGTLYDAQKLLTESKVARLVVTDKTGKLRGMLTRRDLVRFLSADRSGRPLDLILVRETMSSPAFTLPPSATLAEAALNMNKKGISSIVVTDDKGEILGILTKTDLCFHFSLFISKQKVKDYMTRKVFTVRPTHSIFFVVSLLARQGISRVPVADEKLRGIVTLSDIVQTAPIMRPETVKGRGRGKFYRNLLVPMAKLTAMTASDVMTPNPMTTTPEDYLSRVAELMIEHGISGLPVLDPKGKIRGIVTKTDVVRAIAR